MLHIGSYYKRVGVFCNIKDYSPQTRRTQEKALARDLLVLQRWITPFSLSLAIFHSTPLLLNPVISTSCFTVILGVFIMDVRISSTVSGKPSED
jgi:hypothetical protein